MSSESFTFIGGGQYHTASNSGAAIVGGENNDASGSNSFIGGEYNNNTTGALTAAIGGGFISANGEGAAAIGGANNQSNGAYSSIVGGAANNTSGYYSAIVGGTGSLAKSYGETVVGNYNTDYTPASTTAINANDRLFVMGNGTAANARSNALTVFKNGRVGIGTNDTASKNVATGYLLSVAGKIACEEVLVQLSGSWPDYVFRKDYNLLPLKEVEKYIREHNHLPNVPSAKEVEEKGIELSYMNKILMEKVEELTLHVIAQQKLIEEQGAILKKLLENPSLNPKN
jgi:hypothetical protein